MSAFDSLLRSAVRSGEFVRLVLSRPHDRVVGDPEKVSVRPIPIGKETQFQWTNRVGSKELHENVPAEEFLLRVSDIFPATFSDAHLFLNESNVTARTRPDGSIKIKRKSTAAEPTTVATHNREKDYILPAGDPVPFLIEGGVMDPTGRVFPALYHKFRQINRYLEFVRDVADDLPGHDVLRVIDFGSGKSHLTFALHHFLTKHLNREVDILGLDLKEDTIAQCERLARKLDCKGLHFEVGSIADTHLQQRSKAKRQRDQIDLAVSLHACNTATDDALAAALIRRCPVIFAVPCCQHELNHNWKPNVWPGLTGFGLLRERIAPLATDGLRARFLEACGYRTQVIEFIETEHTPKNILIRAIRQPKLSEAHLRQRLAVYQETKAQLGIETWHLEKAIGGEPHVFA